MKEREISFDRVRRWLKLFRAVVEHRNRLAVANSVGYSESNVTVLLRELKECIGDNVVVRNHNGEWQLTDLGTALDEWIKQTFAIPSYILNTKN
jgi:DNA-binding transcriptional LysR family regulator